VEGAPWPRQPEALGLEERIPLKFNARRRAAPETGGAFKKFFGKLFAGSED